MAVDLHTHTTYSDGSVSPKELVSLARKKGLSALAITDHDTVDGLQEGFAAGSAAGVEVISGVEVSAKEGEKTVHLLGYLFDPKCETLLECLLQLQRGREERNGLIVEKLAKQDIIVDEAELTEIAGPGLIGRPHFARLLLQMGLVKTMDEAFSVYLGRNGSAYVSRFSYSLEKMISVIHESGGIAVLAHPRQLNMGTAEFVAFLNRLARLGLDGIEAYYPTHSRQYRKLLHKLAEEKKLIVTGGSDYHGSVRPNTTLAGGKNMAVPDRVIVEMKAKACRFPDMRSNIHII